MQSTCIKPDDDEETGVSVTVGREAEGETVDGFDDSDAAADAGAAADDV